MIKMKAIKIMMLMTALIMAWGCSSDDEDSSGVSTQVVDSKPVWKVNFTGNDAVPDWKAPDPSRYENSMFTMVKLQEELVPYSTDGDRMAVFFDDECRSLPSERNVFEDGSVYFVLKIWGNSSDLDVTVRLSYYSAGLHKVFSIKRTESFAERTYGFDEDFVPPLVKGDSNYPVQEDMMVRLPGNAPFTPNEEDQVGVFMGDVCRGVGHVGKAFTVFRTSTEEQLQLRYYSAEKKTIYTFAQPVGHNKEIVLSF